jgi:solute carrier family 25 S-adenosylmethionine transporter 26
MQALRHFKRPSQLFRGYTPLVLRNLPFTAMQFPMFEHFKASIKKYREARGSSGSLTETAIVTATSAGAAGSIAAVITTPVDVVKTRMMLSASGETSTSKAKEKAKEALAKGQTAENLARSEGVKSKGGITVAKEVFRENGIRGLFRGGALRGIWTALGSGLYLGVYESGRVWLGGGKPEDYSL